MEQQKSGFSQFILIFMFLLTLFILFDPSLRIGIGNAIGYLLNKPIGFDYKFPVWTLWFASLISVALTTILRHYFTNYVENAKNQKLMSAFQKEFFDARKNNNLHKIKVLTEMQPKVMQMQSSLMMEQMKPMVFTMIIIIGIFTWLAVFLHYVDYKAIAVPWDNHWSINIDYNAPYSNTWIIPHWIILYSLLSIPFGQFLLRILKLYSWEWKYKLKLIR